MAKQIIFSGKCQVSLEKYQPLPPEEGMVSIRTLYSLMSTGTENIIFNQIFEPGTHWDRWVKYPFSPGYSVVGEVVQLGANVTSLNVGDKVVVRMSHSSHFVVPANVCYPIPTGVDLKEAAWFALAKIGFMGARVASYCLGDTVLIIGAGPIGQVSIRWAQVAGAENIIVVDPVAQRLEMAIRGGATKILSKSIEECHSEIDAATHGQMPRIVIDTTGNAKVFTTALKLARYKGRVVLLGDTGTPSNQHLSSDVIVKGLTVAGAHDAHEDLEWNAATINRFFFSLLKSGRFNLSRVNTHEFLPQDCVQAYELANTRRGETMGILFDWTR